MVQKLSTRYTSTVATLLAHVVTFAVETRKVLVWSSFSYVPGSEIDERGGEEWETKGFTAAVMWGLVEQGGYALVGRITADRMT